MVGPPFIYDNIQINNCKGKLYIAVETPVPGCPQTPYDKKTDTPGGVSLHLRRRIQHVFNKDAVAGGRIVHKDMSNGADEFAVLNNR